MENEKMTNQKPRLSMVDAVTALPGALRKQFAKQTMCALIISVLTVILMICGKNWKFCVGFLCAMYFVYMDVQLVQRWHKGKILCKRCKCIKANKIPLSRKQLLIVLKEIDVPDTSSDGLHTFAIAITPKMEALLTKDTILDIYYDVESDTQLLGWELVGVL